MLTWAGVCMTLLMILGILMILIILLQRGRGGGLAGAFGGLGGQSAFGTKAGDVFTKITICFAVAWTVLAGVSGILLRASTNQLYSDSVQADEKPDAPIPKASAVNSEDEEDDKGGRAQESKTEGADGKKAADGDEQGRIDKKEEAPDRDSNKSDSSADSGEGSSEKLDSSDSKGTDK